MQKAHVALHVNFVVFVPRDVSDSRTLPSVATSDSLQPSRSSTRPCSVRTFSLTIQPEKPFDATSTAKSPQQGRRSVGWNCFFVNFYLPGKPHAVV